MRAGYTRRQFLSRSAQLGAAGALAGGLGIAGCSGGGDAEGRVVLPAEEGSPGVMPAALPPFQFTELQRAALGAAVARLVPAQGAADWSAADAGAVEYIETLLNAFSLGGNPKIYPAGPSRGNFARFQRLSRVKQAGWVNEVLRLREVYSQGLDELNRLARGPLSLLGGDFSRLPGLLQDALLLTQDLRNTDFFQALFAHTMEGVYGHPVYGGNRDYIAWNSNCYAGDVHGVRFPNGQDPDADDRPWDKYGGYSPEEMALPGSGCNGFFGLSTQPAASPEMQAAAASGRQGRELLHHLAGRMREQRGTYGL